MEKRFFLAFFLTLIFLLVWGRFVTPPVKQELQKPVHTVDTQESATDAQVEKLITPGFMEEAQVKDLPKVKIENFIITYSPTGGYIYKMSIKGQVEPLPFRHIGFIPEDRDKQFTVALQPDRIIFTGPSATKKEFIFKGYDLEIKIPSPPPQMLLFSNYWHTNELERRYQEIFFGYDREIERNNPKKIKPGAYHNVSFAGSRDRYYCFSLFKGVYELNWVADKNYGQLYLISPQALTRIYIGPQTSKLLEQRGLGSIISFGFFHGIGALMVRLLHFFFGLVKNWGLSIIFFAIFTYLCLFPFTMKSTRAMRRMQEIQPEIEALKIKYKDNPQKFGKEQLELFRKYRINPLGGCLPLFLQLPIFIALSQVLSRFFELKGADFLWIKDLSLPDRAFHLPFIIPLLGEYVNILPILIIIVGLFQQKISTPRTASSEQKLMGLLFSVSFGAFFYGFPAGLVLYWFVQNVLGLIYQLRISKTHFLQPASQPAGSHGTT